MTGPEVGERIGRGAEDYAAAHSIPGSPSHAILVAAYIAGASHASRLIKDGLAELVRRGQGEGA